MVTLRPWTPHGQVHGGGALLPQWTAWTARSGEMREWGELHPSSRAHLQCPLAWLSPPSTGAAWTHTRAPQGCGRVRVICHAVQVAPSFKGGDATSIFWGADSLASSRLVWSSILSRSQLARLWAERHTPGLDSLGGRQGVGMVPMVQMSQALDPRPTSSLGSGGQSPECTPGSHHQDGQECSEGTLKK